RFQPRAVRTPRASGGREVSRTVASRRLPLRQRPTECLPEGIDAGVLEGTLAAALDDADPLLRWGDLADAGGGDAFVLQPGDDRAGLGRAAGDDERPLADRAVGVHTEQVADGAYLRPDDDGIL